MPQLRRAVQVVGALGVLDLLARPLDLLTDPLQLPDGLALGLPLRRHRIGLFLQLRELPAQGLQTRLARLVRLLGERGLLDLELHDTAGDLVELLGHRVDLGPHHRARLVDEVDRLVGQEPIGDVSMRQRGRRHHGAVLDLHAVVHLEALAQTAQDRDRLLHRWLIDDHRLEATLERRVLLDVLAVLVQGGGADAVELTAGEHGLEHVAGVHRALGRTGAHDGVQLVDEQDDLALGGLDLREHGLQALLELAPELGPRDHRAEVEGEDRAAAEPLGDIAAHDPLREPFDDRGLADPGVADQDRIVLRLA